MSAGGKSKKQKKIEYFDKLVALLEEYPSILFVNCDNIGSAHMQQIRKSLRGRGVLLMGKNTLIRRAVRVNIHRNKLWENLLELVFGNVGMVFTKEDLSSIRDLVQSMRVPAAAKAGTFAPKDVFVNKGMTNLEPTKTNFLQALNVPSKINRGQIEILNDIHLIKKGERVGSSESTLLQMLDVKPFEYGLNVTSVYDNGCVYSVDILNLKDSDVIAKFAKGISEVAALSLGIQFPTLAAFPHVVLNGFKNLAAISVETDYDFDQAKKLKEMIKNPGAFAVATQAPSAPVTRAPAPKPEPVADKPKEPSEEPAAFDLFG